MFLTEVFASIEVIKNYPKDGIIFRHIGPLLKNTKLFKRTIHYLCTLISDECDVIAGIDARGFIISTAIQYHTDIPQVMIRKQSKLPGPKYTCEYKKEYGFNTLELEIGSITRGQKVLIVDDLMATAGTLIAAANLVTQAGGIVSGIMTLIEFKDLNGRKRITDLYPECEIISLFSLNSFDDTNILTRSIDISRPVQITRFAQCAMQDRKIVNVYVASTNVDKLTAVHEASISSNSSIFPNNQVYDIYSIDCISSEISEQPLGYQETIAGANNRLMKCIEVILSDTYVNHDDAIFIAIENGMKSDNRKDYSDFCVVYYKIGKYGPFVRNISNDMNIPSEYNEYVKQSLESKNRSVTLGSILKKKFEITDWHKYVSGTSRKDIIKTCLI